MNGYTFLDDDDVLIVSRPLAKMIGLKRSIVLRQIRFWLRLNDKANKKENFRDDCWWSYNTYEKWQRDNFDFLEEHSIRRCINSLEDDYGLLVSTSKYNDRKGDQTKWYTINYGAYQSIAKLWVDHRSPRCGDGHPSVEYIAFLEDWKVQKMEHTNCPTWTDQLSKLDRAVVQLGQTVTRDSTESPTEKKEKDIPPAAVVAASPSKNIGAKHFEAIATAKGEEDSTASDKKYKPKVQPELARNLADIFAIPAIAKEKLKLIKSECELYDSDPNFKSFIDGLLSRYVRKKDGVTVHDRTMDQYIVLIQEKKGWNQYLVRQKPTETSDESYTPEFIAALAGETGIFGKK